jgi:branched-chain amino acid transport system permease protein
MSGWYDSHLILVLGTFVNVLLALSVQVPLRMGTFSMAGVGSFGIGAYGTAILVTQHGWPPWPAILGASVLAAVAGLVLGLVITRLAGIYLGMATIAFDLILTVVVLNGGSTTGGSQGIYGVLADVRLIDFVTVVAVVVLAVAWTERGRFGRYVEALREDPTLATSVGVDVRRLRLLAFVVSGFLGALAGGMDVLVRTTVTPDDIGFSLVVLALTMIVVGGSRSWLGALVGALIFTWLPSILSVVGSWQDLVYGCTVAVAAVWIPGGLVGIGTDVVRWMQARRRTPPQQPVDDRPDTLPELAAPMRRAAVTDRAS